MTAISTFRFHIELIDDLFIKGFSGRIVHGAFLEFLKIVDEDLATYLHEYQGRQPYSLTKMEFRKMGEQWVAYFDVNTMDEQMIQTLVKLLVSQQQQEIFVIDRFCPIFKVEYNKTMIPDPSSLPIGTRIWINFETPTVFANSRRRANTDPFPHLDVIWRQVLDTYSRLVDEIPEQDQAMFIRYALNQLATPKFKVRSKHMTLGHKIKVTGFEGSIMFMIEDNTHLELLEPMLKLVEVWGLGGKTTMGFGQVSINVYPPDRDNNKKKSRGKRKEQASPSATSKTATSRDTVE